VPGKREIYLNSKGFHSKLLLCHMHCLGFGLNEVNRDGNIIWHGFGLKCRSLKLNAAVIQKHVSGEKGARGEATSL